MALPNGPMEIVFSFDTTGSMCSCLNEVRGRVQDMVQRLQADIPGIKIAIFAHGDYCDAGSKYVTKYEDFTDNVAQLCNFAKTVEGTGGGDADECYELVLHQVRTELSWTPGSQRALVMIGDCNPHEPNYPQNKLKLNWRNEADELGRMGVRIYSVQCKERGNATQFYKSIADRTGGRHLKLNQFQNIFDFIMAVCYREKGADFLDNYEAEVRSRCGPVHKDLHQLFGDLRDSGPSSAPKPKTSTKVPKLPAKVVKVKKASTSLKRPKCMKSVNPALTLTIPSHLKYLKKETIIRLGYRHLFFHRSCMKYLDKALPLLKRENVPQTNFLLRDLSWSQWKLAIRPNEKGQWRKRNGDGCGYRAPTLFHGRTRIPAIYEVAVQPKDKTRRFVVYCKTSKGFGNKANWEKTLLGKKNIRAQIDAVVQKYCSVYIRRAILKGTKAQEKLKQAMKRYDYAWKSIRSVRKCHRNCTKLSVRISDSTLGV